MATGRRRAKFHRMKSKKISGSKSAEARSTPPTNEQIAALAHAIWIDRGSPYGRDLDHWLEAERQLRGIVEPLGDEGRLDPEIAPAARIDRELERIVSPPAQRSPTSL
jgi:hypothetical protein